MVFCLLLHDSRQGLPPADTTGSNLEREAEPSLLLRFQQSPQLPASCKQAHSTAQQIIHFSQLFSLSFGENWQREESNWAQSLSIFQGSNYKDSSPAQEEHWKTSGKHRSTINSTRENNITKHINNTSKSWDIVFSGTIMRTFNKYKETMAQVVSKVQ